MLHRSQSPGSKSAGWDLSQPRGKASHSDAPCSHAHVSLERKHRFKHKFKLLKLGPRFPIGRSVCYCHTLYTALLVCPLVLPYPSPCTGEVLSHQMPFRAMSPWSENALGKCRKHTVKLGSSISSAECDSFTSVRISAQQSTFWIRQANNTFFFFLFKELWKGIWELEKFAALKKQLLRSLLSWVSPWALAQALSLAFAVSAEPVCSEVIISASYSRSSTTFLFFSANKHLSPPGRNIMSQGEKKCPRSSDLSRFSNYLYQECNVPGRQHDWHTMSLSIILLSRLQWATKMSGKLQLSWPSVEEIVSLRFL